LDAPLAAPLFLAGAVMIGYASRTGTKRNLDALRRRGWGLLVSRAGAWRREGFVQWAADNGAWSDYQAHRDFDEDAYERFLTWVEAQEALPDWLVLPDVVAGGTASLALSTRYLNRCQAVAPLVLIAVQDGMEEADVAPLVSSRVGLFLGGSTEWKLANMIRWGRFCAARRCYYHIARVNTFKRMALAQAAGAASVDGSSVSRYSVTVTNLTNGLNQPDLWRIAA
jgi:hypothetical protein